MAQLLFTLLFVALAVVGVRAIARELTRPLHQPWLDGGFTGPDDRDAIAPVDLAEARLRRRALAMSRKVPQPFSAAA